MLNPKELFRFNATTREKKPSTTRGRTPIDTYPPTVIPAVADRVLAPDIAPPPTKEEARAANAGEFAGETRVVKKVGGNKALKVVLAGGAVVAGGAVAYENVPAVHRAVDSAFLNHIKGSSKATAFEERFPIVLSKDSFTPVTHEEERLLWQNTKTVDLENHTFTIGFPVDQATIDKSPNLRMNSYFDQDLISGPPSLIQVVEKLKEQGYKNVIQLSGFSKDTKIYYRYDPTKFEASIIKIAIAGEIQGEGSNSFTPAYTNYLITLRDKQSGKIYQGGIDALYAKPLIAPTPYPEKTYPMYENGTRINPDEPILQLTTDLQDWDGQGQVLPGQRGQVVIYSTGGGFVSIGDAISDAQKGIYNPDAFFTTSFLTTSRDTLAVTK